MSLLHHDIRWEAFAVASHFRDDFFDCLTARRDTLFELTDALLCTDGPVTTPVDLTLTAEHRRGHGAMYDALNCGNVDVPRLRQVLAGLPQPEAADGRLVLEPPTSASVMTSSVRPVCMDHTATCPLVDSKSASACSSQSPGSCGGGAPSHTSTSTVAVWVCPPLVMSRRPAGW